MPPTKLTPAQSAMKRTRVVASKHVDDDHAHDVGDARGNPKDVVGSESTLALEDRKTEAQREDPGWKEERHRGCDLDARRIGVDHRGERCRLDDEDCRQLGYADPGERRCDPASLARVASDVVGHRRGKPESPGDRADGPDDDEQREVPAILGAEAAGDEDAADDDEQLQAAGCGERPEDRAAGARSQARRKRLHHRQLIPLLGALVGLDEAHGRPCFDCTPKPLPQQTRASPTEKPAA